MIDQFQGILKPAYNAIDMLELELLDDDSEPREFSKELLKVYWFVEHSKEKAKHYIRIVIECWFSVYHLGSRTNHKSSEWQLLYDGEISYGWYGKKFCNCILTSSK